MGSALGNWRGNSPSRKGVESKSRGSETSDTLNSSLTPLRSLVLTHTHTELHAHTRNIHTHVPSVIGTVRRAQTNPLMQHFQDHLGSMLVTLCLQRLIRLKAVHLFLPSDKQCLSLCGSWGWRTLACIRTVRRSVVDQRFNEPCLRSLIKT